MRYLVAAGVVLVCVAVSFAVGKPEAAVGPSNSVELSQTERPFQTIALQAVRGKPQPQGGAPRVRGADTCRWARDNECDEPGIGTGVCPANSDYSDCRYIREGEGDYCQWARDGECDEPIFSTGACPQGSDRSDCGQIAWLRNQNDTCSTAFNGVCEEPGRGNGSCRARTDRSDCQGRSRPMSITDHFGGHDDRVLVNVQERPWRYMGELQMDGGEGCTATLIARDVLLTAAHCIHREGRVNANGSFISALGQRARITGYLIDPGFNYRLFATTSQIDYMDWALLRIDRPIGDETGFASLYDLNARGQQVAQQASLYQAGYAWDTGSNLAGNIDCRVQTVFPDNTFSHGCDITRGDSGSAFLIRSGNTWQIVGVTSNFRSNPRGAFIYMAVATGAFIDYAPDFIAGRTGTRLGGPPGSMRKR
jgi:protease YdgD